MHGEDLFRALNEISIAIEHGERTRQNIVVSAFSFSKVQTLYVDVSKDDKFGIPISRFEKLRVQVDWKIVQFLLGVHCIYNFLLGLLVRIGEVLRRVIAAAGLQHQLLWVLEGHLQSVKSDVELEVLRNECQHIGILCRLSHTAETFIEIVAVMEKDTTGAVR